MFLKGGGVADKSDWPLSTNFQQFPQNFQYTEQMYKNQLFHQEKGKNCGNCGIFHYSY